jgi:hypothetical protein
MNDNGHSHQQCHSTFLRELNSVAARLTRGRQPKLRIRILSEASAVAKVQDVISEVSDTVFVGLREGHPIRDIGMHGTAKI